MYHHAPTLRLTRFCFEGNRKRHRGRRESVLLITMFGTKAVTFQNGAAT